MTAAVAIGLLAAGGTYLVLQRGLVRLVIGFVVLQHAVNLLLVTARGRSTGAPLAPLQGDVADPLGQAFTLTAIVIGLGTSLFLLSLALRRAHTHREDDVEEEV